jgi:hypothetical protein
MELQRLLRSVAMVSIVTGVCLVFFLRSVPWSIPIIYAIIASLSLGLITLLEYYVDLAVICRSYILALDDPKMLLEAANSANSSGEGEMLSALPDKFDAEVLAGLMKRLRTVTSPKPQAPS